MAQVRIWAILGADSVGKSTTIGHLIGDFGKGRGGLRPGPGGMRQVLLRGGGYLTVFSRRTSWQEAGEPPEGVVKFIRQQNLQFERRGGRRIVAAYFNVLTALRTDRLGRFPPAEDYLSHFVKQDWHIESLALLSPTDADEGLYHRFGAPTCYVYDSCDIQIGWMVGQVRNHFGWA
jgi:hypothetical protein